MVDIAVLLSVGRHPASGRARRAPLDAQALELALRLSRPVTPPASTRSTPVTRRNRRSATTSAWASTAWKCWKPPPEPIPSPRSPHACTNSPALILTGAVAEGGEDSGMVPYLIAQALNHTLVPDIIGIDVTDAKRL